MRVLDLPAVLRAAGCTVVEVSGWRTRGPELTALRGGVVHHTATSATARGDYPTLALVRDGRVGIPGPLSQLGLGRSGVWYVIASGRANHAGVVHSRFATTHSNEYALGVEAEHPGRGAWPRVQYDSYVRGCAALSRAYGITWCGHKEVAAPAGRKVDPTFDMGMFRAAVTASRASLPGSTPGTIPTVPDLTAPEPLTPIAPEDDDMPTIIRRRTADGSASLIVGAHSIPGLGKYSLRAIAETYPDAKTVTLSEQDYDTMLALHPPVTTDILAAKVAERVLTGLPNADAETIRAAVRQGFHDLVLRADTTP